MKKILLLSLLTINQFFSGYSQTLLSDIRPGLDGSEPGFDNAVQKGGDIYFVAQSDATSSGLYKTDGTTGNTILLEGGSNAYISMILGVLGDEILYIAGNAFSGEQPALYKTTGDPGAGEFVIDYNQNNDFLIAYPMHIVMDNVLYFYGAEGNTGYELWRTDGTAAGTYLVKDINPGIESSILFTAEKNQFFTELNGYIYFGAAEPVNGAELWRTDGTEAGTTMVANIDPSTPQIAQMGSNPAYFCTYNNAVYFSAYRPVDGRELWKTDGTSAGTVLVKDLAAGDGSPTNLMEHNGSLYFSAYYPDQNYTLYKSNGTAAGTNAIRQPDNGGPITAPGDAFVSFKGKLFFSADNGQGSNIWYTDGTAAGTNFLPDTPDAIYSYPMNLLATTNYLYFTAVVSETGFNAGVFRTTENPNQMTLLTAQTFNANNNQPLWLVNECLLVRGDDGTAGEEIYTVCNQNTQPLGLDETVRTQLSAFPNPCSDKVTITCGSGAEQITGVSLYSTSGNSVRLPFTQLNQQQIVVNGLSTFSSGIYFLTVEVNNTPGLPVKLIVE